MVDKLTKFINRLDKQKRELVLRTMLDIFNGKLNGYDVTKLKGKKTYYRLRKGRIRIIFEQRGNQFRIIKVDYRDERTYDGL
jgi:mRNA-degrading endonuclease RelE of RelBE toxin-antitoxin system